MRSARPNTTRMSCSISTIAISAAAVQIANEFGDGVSLLIAHARRRLVEQQQTRPQGQRHGDLGDALVAVGEFADQAIGLAGQPREIEDLVDLGRASPISRRG